MKKRLFRRAVSAVLASALAVAAAPAVYADDTYYIYIENPGTVLYRGAGTEYRTAGTIPGKGKINYLGSALDKDNVLWYNVGSAGGTNGWVSSEYATRYYKNTAVPKTPKADPVISDNSAYMDISEQIYDSATAMDAVGVQAAVIRGSDGEEFGWSWGYAVLGSAKMTDETKLSAGAVSETAVAAAAMKLQESGRLNMGAGISSYWGITTAQPVSLTMLLTHSSGLRPAKVPSALEGMSVLLGTITSFDTRLKAGTSAGWQYNPTGIAAAGATLELAAKDTLDSYAKKNIFAPIGADLSFYAGGISGVNALATMYGEKHSVELLKSEAKKILPSGVAGADQSDLVSGLTGSAMDIAKLYSMLANDGKYGGEQVLKASSVTAMEKKYFTEKENGTEFRQCTGMRYQAKMYGTSGLYYQSGEKNGVLTFASYDPKTKNTVVVMASGASQKYDKSGIYKVCGDIASRIYSILSEKNRKLYKYPSAKGAALKAGDTIGIVATSYYIKDDAYTKAVNYLKNAGYNVKIAPSVTARYRYYAGTDKQRAKDINDFFEDDDIDAILCLHGGNGAAGVLPYLDYDMIAQHPKLFIGYSDVTALHIALSQRSGIATVHGPMLSSFVSTVYRYTSEQFLNGLANSEPIGAVELPSGVTLKPVVEGTAEGKIIGGNLTVIASLAGTDYELQGDHNILLIEETGEYASSIDRLLRQLEMNGLFDRVDGILIGTLTDCPATDGVTADQVIISFAERIGKPCIKGLPSGHSGLNMFLPLGVMAKMTVYKNGPARLELLESAALG